MTQLFIHIPKTGGSSIRFLKKNGMNLLAAPEHLRQGVHDEVQAELRPLGLHLGFHHARWRDIDPLISSTSRAFAIIRNPWARVVSRFAYLKKIAASSGQEHVAGVDSNCSFDHFFDYRFLYGNREYFWFRAILSWFNQVEYVIDDAGHIRCDILRTEHPEEIAEYLGIDHLPHRNVSVDGDYRKYYTASTYDIVASWYADDIELFGFTFDGSATKNIWTK